MFKKLIKSFKRPKRALQFISFMLSYIFRKKRGVLFFIGMDPNGVFSFMHRGYEHCYGFEANPERYEKLLKKYKNHSRISILNVAVTNYDGEITFNISNNNNGASSSVGNFKEDWKHEYKGERIEMIKSITVPCINLINFCKKYNISYIDDYVSDIQGMDLEVLKTIKPMIDERRIGTITCEVAKNSKSNVYRDLPDNSENGFEELLNDNYILIARGWGSLKNGRFDKIPDDVWEMDCKWIANKNL